MKLRLFKILFLTTCLLIHIESPTVTAQSGNQIERVSVSSDGAEGNDNSFSALISADGRYIVFVSGASNLVPGDTNNRDDIFVRDRQTGQTTRVSVSSAGVQGNSYSDSPSISADGRFVAFYSSASNLVPGDTNNAHDVFVYDRQTGQTTHVSVASDGTQGNDVSWYPSISADGRYVAFESGASNLVLGDTNGTNDIFVRDRQIGQTTRVSVTSNGTQGNDVSWYPSISADGRYVAFQSYTNNLVPGDTNNRWDVFVHDRQMGQTTRVSVAPNGTETNGGSSGATISANGRYVAFRSIASNLVVDDTNGYEDIFVHDRQMGQTTRVSVGPSGTETNEGSSGATISANGRYVAFRSIASNLVPGDTNGFQDAFVHDWQAGQTTRVSVVSNGAQANGNSFTPSISADGYSVALDSNASNLVSGDTNGMRDVFVAAVSVAPPPPPTLSISHIEVTQVIQDTENLVPLIANKPTFARVYVDCGAGCSLQRNVTGELRAYNQFGVERPGSPIQPVNREITASHWVDWRLVPRDNLDMTLNFTLPPEWLEGTVTLTAEVSDATLSETVTFLPAKPLRIVHVPIRYNGREPDMNHIEEANRFAQQMYPTSQISYALGDTLEWSKCLENQFFCSYTANSKDLLKELRNRYFLEDTYVFGWMPDGNYFANGRASYIGGRAAWGKEHPTEAARIFVHEIGHLLDQYHTNTIDNLNHPKVNMTDLADPGCRHNSDPKEWDYNGSEYQWDAYVEVLDENDWPFSTSRIQHFGLDALGFAWLLSSSSALRHPSNEFDYMSYCGSLQANNLWTSGWIYEQLYEDHFKVDALNSPLALQPMSAGSYIIVSGLVYTDNHVDLDPIWHFEPETPPHNPPAGTDYCVEAQDSLSNVLSSYCFDLTFRDQESMLSTTVDGFSIALPYPLEVARIVLKKGAQELAVQSVIGSSPQVEVALPNGGEVWGGSESQIITWTGSDADNDALTYRVYYSQDGNDWMPIGSPTEANQLTINTSALPGSTTAKIRVMATDGINTSTDESDAPFTVGAKAPNVSIISPQGSQTIEPDTPLLLQGSAYDLEDGNLSGDALTWNSNLDGALGTGETILTSLSAGQHIVTLSVLDKDGNMGAAAISIKAQVTPPKAPTARPAMIAPANNALLNDNTPLLAWNAVNHADGYQVQISASSNFSAPLQDSTLGLLEYEADTLVDGVYHWRVRGLSGVGNGPWGAARRFTIDTVSPGIPTLTAPAEGAIIANGRLTFQWGAASQANRYEVQLGLTNPPDATIATTTMRSYTLPYPLALTGTYHWRVRALDAAGNPSAWTTSRNFTYPESPTNAVPIRNFFDTATPTLMWSPLSWAYAYEIEIDADPKFATAGHYTRTVNGLSHTVEISLGEGEWYWRVRAVGGAWSLLERFVVDVP